jgi:hypothetical protein
VGGGTPIPRKLSDASAMKATPRKAEEYTSQGATQFMAMWRIAIRHFDAPAITADSIKRDSLRETAVDRVTLFTLGKPPTAIAIMTFMVEVPKTAMIIIARTIAGIASNESMNR